MFTVCYILQVTTTSAAASSAAAAPATSTNVAGVDLALLVDQLTRTGSSPEITATILSTLVATSPDAGPDEQKQILQRLTEALRERQKQIELQKLATVTGAGGTSSAPPSIISTIVSSSQFAGTVSATPSQLGPLPSPVVTGGIADKEDKCKPIVTATKESAAKPDESALAESPTAPGPSVTTSFTSVVPSSAVVSSTQQWLSNFPVSSTVSFSSVNVPASSALPVTVAATTTAGIHPPATSALPPAIQQLLSGQSFENLKNILANVTSRKTGGVSIRDPSGISSTVSVARIHETLDSYTTSKGSRSDLHKTVPPESNVAEPDELFVANIHGDVDYRVRPAAPVPSEPPTSTQPLPANHSGWIKGGDQFPLSGDPPIQQPEEPYVSRGGPLLPGPFSQNSSYPSKNTSGGPLLPMPPRIGKHQGLLPTPERSKPAGEQEREERGRGSRGRKQRSEDAETDRDRSRYRGRRPFDDRSSSREDRRDDHRRRRSSRERADSDQRSERREERRSYTRKQETSSRGSEERSVIHVPHSDEEPIIVEDDCSNIPLPPTTAASKPDDARASTSEASVSKNQNFDADRKALLPTPDKEVSAGEKRKLDEPRREQKFSRSWTRRHSPTSSSRSSKAVPETKGKQALLETPVASDSSEFGRASDSPGDGYHRDAKDSRTYKRDSDSKSYDRHRSRSRSGTRNVAADLVDRSQRRLGLSRRPRSSSRDTDRRHSSHSNSGRRRSQSREQRSASRDRLQQEEEHLRRQLDDLRAEKSEENRNSHHHQSGPPYGQEQRHEQSLEKPSIFNAIPGSDARANATRSLPRRHLLPAPHLVSANLASRPLLQPPPLQRPLVEGGPMMPNVDRNAGIRFSHSSDQPLASSPAILPGRPFVHEYSHKPAETRVDQVRFGEDVDHSNSRKESESGRSIFREEPSRHRYRPYPNPEDRHRMPPESTERSRNWQVRDQQNEQTDTSSRTSDFSGRQKARLSEAGVSEQSPVAVSMAEKNSDLFQSAASAPSAPDDIPAQTELPPSSLPDIFSSGETLLAKLGVRTPEAAMTAEDEATVAATAASSHPVMPPVPNFPIFLPNARNPMFPRIPPRVPFNLLAAAGILPGPRIRGLFGPPPPVSFPATPVDASSVHQAATPAMTTAIRQAAALSRDSPEPSTSAKKSLLGDYPGNKTIAPLMAGVTSDVASDKDTGHESSAQQLSEEFQGSEEQSLDQEPSTPDLMVPLPLLESDQTQNAPDSQVPLDNKNTMETGEDQELEQFTGEGAEEQHEEQEHSEIPPLMDFTAFRSGRSAPGPKPLRFGPPLRGGPPPSGLRDRMQFPPGGVPYHPGMRGRPVPPVLRAIVDMHLRRGGPGAMPRRSVPPFPPRGAPRFI